MYGVDASGVASTGRALRKARGGVERGPREGTRTATPQVVRARALLDERDSTERMALPLGST